MQDAVVSVCPCSCCRGLHLSLPSSWWSHTDHKKSLCGVVYLRSCPNDSVCHSRRYLQLITIKNMNGFTFGLRACAASLLCTKDSPEGATTWRTAITMITGRKITFVTVWRRTCNVVNGKPTKCMLKRFLNRIATLPHDFQEINLKAILFEECITYRKCANIIT